MFRRGAAHHEMHTPVMQSVHLVTTGVTVRQYPILPRLQITLTAEDFRRRTAAAIAAPHPNAFRLHLGLLYLELGERSILASRDVRAGQRRVAARN